MWRLVLVSGGFGDCLVDRLNAFGWFSVIRYRLVMMRTRINLGIKILKLDFLKLFENRPLVLLASTDLNCLVECDQLNSLFYENFQI